MTKSPTNNKMPEFSQVHDGRRRGEMTRQPLRVKRVYQALLTVAGTPLRVGIGLEIGRNKHNSSARAGIVSPAQNRILAKARSRRRACCGPRAGFRPEPRLPRS